MRRFLTGRLMAWIAIVAMLFNTLAPSVSHAVVAAQVATTRSASLGATWTEVCTDRGTLWVQTAADGTVLAESLTPPTPEPRHAQQHFNDCAYCLTHAGSFGLVPVQHSAGLVLALPTYSYSSGYSFTIGRHTAWERPAPRAPPVAPAV